MEGTKLSVRFAVLVTLVMAASAVLYFAWNSAAQHEAIKNKAIAEARTLNTEMHAVWDYIDDSQDVINENSDGTYDFKGIYCAVAGREIANRFSKESRGYTIRYVRENPRIGTDAPDEFEARAFDAFSAGRKEFYEVTSYGGGPALRYASALTIEENCLSCHGSPAGEFDAVGFLKEGMEVGDVGGAVSISIPLDAYERESAEDFARSMFFFIGLTTAIVLIVRFALNRWVAEPLARANAQLQSENEAKSNFLTIMSHELRTPLSSILAAADFWKKTTDGSSPKEERIVDEIKENSAALLDMVNNTIDVARLEAGAFEVCCCEVDPTDVVNSTVRAVESLARKQGVELVKRVDADAPIVMADPEALRKIMMNLLSNALKFTEEGGHVSLDVAYRFDAEELVVTVEDTGIGIPPDNLEIIFSRFEQGPYALAQGKTGSGLGLFLVKGLSEQLGGGVSVRSAVGEGSVFTVWIPAPPIEVAVDEEEDE